MCDGTRRLGSCRGGRVTASSLHSPFFLFLRSETEALEKRQSAVDRIFDRYVSEICITLDEISHIYNRTLVALFRQNTRVLRDMSRRSAKLCREAEARRRAGVTLQRGGVADMGAWLFGTRATIYLAEMCEALERIVRPACEHVEHDGGALTREQTVALMRLNDGIDAMTHKVSEALSERTSSAETSGGVLRCGGSGTMCWIWCANIRASR